jgi:putative ABC transport system substrate-binding protein
MRGLLLITALWLLIPGTAWSYDLLIVQSQRSPVYDDVLRGLRSVARFSERMVVLTDYNELDLQRIVREENPAAIITLGDKALAAARKVKQKPLVALMAISSRSAMASHPAMTGVEIQPAPERYLQVFAAIKSRRIGIVSNGASNAAYLKHARKAAAGLGIELVVREVRSSREVQGQLESLAGQLDALWMLPDSVTASGEAADAHFLFSARQNIPVVTFSSAYLVSGAAIALDADRFEMGKQAGEMASALLEGYAIADMPPAAPRKSAVKSNPSILRRLGIKPELDLNRSLP